MVIEFFFYLASVSTKKSHVQRICVARICPIVVTLFQQLNLINNEVQMLLNKDVIISLVCAIIKYYNILVKLSLM